MLNHVSPGQKLAIVNLQESIPVQWGEVIKILPRQVQVRTGSEVRSFSKATGHNVRNAFLYAYTEAAWAARTASRAASVARLTANGASFADSGAVHPTTHVQAIEGLLDMNGRLRVRIWLTDNGQSWASDHRRRLLGKAVEFTRFGFYDLGADDRYRRDDDPGQYPVARSEMD